jgi:hypothetical protein
VNSQLPSCSKLALSACAEWSYGMWLRNSCLWRKAAHELDAHKTKPKHIATGTTPAQPLFPNNAMSLCCAGEVSVGTAVKARACSLSIPP